MNGIISGHAERSTLSPSTLITSVALGVCMFSGFVFGMNVNPEQVAGWNPFRTQSIHFDKISWISAEKIENFKVATLTEEASAPELSFSPFELKLNEKKLSSYSPKKHFKNGSNLSRLERLVKEIQTPKINIFKDYQNASSELRHEFIATVDPVRDTKQTIAMTVSSAVQVTKPVALITASMSAAPLPVYRAPAKVRTHQLHIPVSVPVTQVPEEIVSEPAPVITPVLAPITEPAEAVTTQSETLVNRKESFASEPIEQAVINTQTIAEADKPLEISVSGSLSASEQKVLTERLLNEQLKTQGKIAQANPPVFKSGPIGPQKASNPNYEKTEPTPAPENLANNDGKWHVMEPAVKPNYINDKNGECTLLDTHKFEKAVGSNSALDTQVCPDKKTWISKSRDGSGWVKIESEQTIPTLTLHPAPNDGSTLLIDINSIAIISMKTGVHVTKGMGYILGVLPPGFKVEFLGRAEEPHYFESNGREYFAILNAEPGAGVLSLEAKGSQEKGTTVFTPVLEDTVTYLDLVAPNAQNISIQVVKSGKAGDPEISNLTVGLSTQTGIQAITQANGLAYLKNVNLVHGFPVFLDVSSRHDQDPSYTYRYQLKNATKHGVFTLNQIADASITHWLKQIKTGLSDQSAMVVGFYNRKHLDGFKNQFFSTVEPLTSKFGLEPLNYSVLWNGELSNTEPLEGDVPRFMSVQIPEGLSQIKLLDESHKMVQSEMFPISPRVIHMISE